jgi:ABC-type transport system substrate-binding protein
MSGIANRTGAFRLDRRRFLQVGAGALALPALVGATGGAVAAASSTNTTLKKSKAKADPNYILQFGEMQDESMDPIRLVAVEYYQLFAIFDTLFSYTADGTLIPRLATGYTATSDKVRVNLRTGVTFQDGTPMDASAVQFSLNRVLNDPSSNIKSAVPMMGSVDVVDSHTIDINLTAPDVQPLIFELSDRAGMIVSPTAVQKAGSSAAFSQAPVGAGPYAIDGQWFPREKMSVRKWSGYWDKSAQTLGGIDFVNVLEAARANALRAGTMDVCSGLLGTDYQALNGTSGLKLSVGPGSVTYALSINITVSPLNNLKVRQAISTAIDRVSMNQALTNGLGVPSYQFASPGSTAYTKSLDSLYKYNPTKAKKLLKEAGFSSGIEFNCITTTTAAAFYDTAELLQSQLKQSGITMNLTSITQGNVTPLTWGSPPNTKGTATAALLAGGVHTPAPGASLDLAFRNQTQWPGAQNPGGVTVPGTLTLINSAAASKTTALGTSYYQKLNKIMTEGVYAIVPLYIGPNITGFQQYVGGNPLAEGDNPSSPDFLRGLYVTQGKTSAYA